MSLTSTFDRKLKSLLTEEKEKKVSIEENLLTKKRNSYCGQPKIEENSLFRDPSLHRTFEKTSKAIEVQVIIILNLSKKIFEFNLQCSFV